MCDLGDPTLKRCTFRSYGASGHAPARFYKHFPPTEVEIPHDLTPANQPNHGNTKSIFRQSFVALAHLLVQSG